MKCPFCREGDFAVVDSRSHRDGFPIRRKRLCNHCKRRVLTVEYLEEAPLKVIKKDESREPFDPAKLRRGLEKACYKRPISTEQIESIVRQVESQVFADCVTSQGNVIVAFGPKFRVKPAADFYAEVRALLGESALA